MGRSMYSHPNPSVSLEGLTGTDRPVLIQGLKVGQSLFTQNGAHRHPDWKETSLGQTFHF
jgi:hypothetical protein